MRLAAFALICAAICHGASPSHDWSLKKRCEFMKGEYTQRSADKATTGDRCSMKFGYATKSESDARFFCETNVPFHILEVKYGGRFTECVAEATLICKEGWVQMFGRCYKMKKKMMRFTDAEAHCRNESARVAFLHREALVPRWRGYFSHVSRIWLTASETFTRNLLYDKGPNLVLAFTPNQFGGNRFDSVVKVDDDKTAMALCEYTPEMNLAESNYLLQKYAEIYRSPVVTSDGVHFRTASHLQGISKNKMKDTEYCQRVMKPFFGVVPVQSAVPTREFIDTLVALENHRDTVIRTSVHSNDAKEESRTNEKCAISGFAKNYGYDYITEHGAPLFRKADSDVWKDDEQPDEKCDGGSWSTAVALSRQTPGLETMSDARFGPIFCQPRFEVQSYGKCPDGYDAFNRTNGQMWCHKFVPELVTYDEAVKKCAEEGAFISGYDSQQELVMMDKLFFNRDAGSHGKYQPDKGKAWLGARRRAQCTLQAFPGLVNGFEKDASSPCSRVRVFEWANGVATNPPDFGPNGSNWMAETEPNSYSGTPEDCLELNKGNVTYWNDTPKDGTMKLNDVPCNTSGRFYFCGKEAPIVTRTVEF